MELARSSLEVGVVGECPVVVGVVVAAVAADGFPMGCGGPFSQQFQWRFLLQYLYVGKGGCQM